MVVQRIYKILIIAPVIILFISLVFRATFYWMFPVALDEPYGFGDILEVFIFLALLGFSLAALICALVLSIASKLRDKSYIVRLIASSALMPTLYLIMHPLMPRLM